MDTDDDKQEEKPEESSTVSEQTTQENMNEESDIQILDVPANSIKTEPEHNLVIKSEVSCV